jgi:hypothetical protein
MLSYSQEYHSAWQAVSYELPIALCQNNLPLCARGFAATVKRCQMASQASLSDLACQKPNW